jgi:hypothetical protein
MKFTVLHAQSRDTRFEFHPPNWTERRDDYLAVAHVEAETLDEVYERTNTIDVPWMEKSGVTALRASRSTSVGDIIIEEGGTEWMVASFGFSELTKEA